MAKSGAQAPAEKPEAQKGSATKMPIFLTKFDGSGSDNTDEFRRTLIGHIELQGIAASCKSAHTLLCGLQRFVCLYTARHRPTVERTRWPRPHTYSPTPRPH